MYTRIIFLDIDGVLNSRKYILSVGDIFDDPVFQVDPKTVKLVNILHQATQAAIVVTSTWRKAFQGQLDKLQDCLASYKIQAPVVGMTDDLAFASNSRGSEIKKYLSEHPEVRNFVIFDDENIAEFPQNLIQTTFDEGLQVSHITRAIEHLGFGCGCSCRACYAGPFEDVIFGGKKYTMCHCDVEIVKALE